MLKWAVIFFVISIISGLFGFYFVEGTSAVVAQVLFFIFLIGFIITAIKHIKSKSK